MQKAVGLVAAGALVGVLISALGTSAVRVETGAGPQQTQASPENGAARAMPPDPPPAMTFVPPENGGNTLGTAEQSRTTNGICPVDPSYFDKDTKGMKPAAAKAWHKAKEVALSQGVTLCAHEAKRSVAEQKAQFRKALERYNGDRKLAEQYVLPPNKSLHVSGLAVDVQPRASAAWLERTAGALGWCRRYANEPWHFEYNKDYVASGCPALKPHP